MEIPFLARARNATVGDVLRLYRDLLHREPESAQVVAEKQGRPIIDVAIAFAQSPEYLARAQSATAEDVSRLYRDLLHREPESAQVVAEKQGRPIIDVAIAFAQSPEFLMVALLRRLNETFFAGQAYPMEWYEEFSHVVKIHGVSLPDLIAYFHKMKLHECGASSANDALVQSVRPQTLRLTNFGSKVTLVVPTINSEPFLDHVIDFYADLGVPVVFAVDCRTSDGTRSLLTRKAADFIEVSGAHRRVESLFADIVAKINTDWILRLDDDELPTPSMLNFVNKTAELSVNVVYGFPLANFQFNSQTNEIQYSQFLPFTPIGGKNLKYRLFKREDFSPDDRLHTAGLVPKDPQSAPPDAFIFHFDWVLRSRPQRLEKLRSYQTQDFDIAKAYSLSLLYENIPDSWHMFRSLPNEKYRTFAEKMYRSLRDSS